MPHLARDCYLIGTAKCSTLLAASEHYRPLAFFKITKSIKFFFVVTCNFLARDHHCDETLSAYGSTYHSKYLWLYSAIWHKLGRGPLAEGRSVHGVDTHLSVKPFYFADLVQMVQYLLSIPMIAQPFWDWSISNYRFEFHIVNLVVRASEDEVCMRDKKFRNESCWTINRQGE